MHARDGDSSSDDSSSIESAGPHAVSDGSSSEDEAEAESREADGTSASSDEEDEGQRATRVRYEEARDAIERAMRGSEGGGKEKIAARCRACRGTLLLSGSTLRAHAASGKHKKNLEKLGKLGDENFVCFYPAVKEDDGVVSDGEAETHAERLARLRAQKILRAAEGKRDEGGKFSLAQFDSSDDEGDEDDEDDDEDGAAMTKRLAKKEFARKAKESASGEDEKSKRSRRHAQRKRGKSKSKPGKRQRMAMKTGA